MDSTELPPGFRGIRAECVGEGKELKSASVLHLQLIRFLNLFCISNVFCYLAIAKRVYDHIHVIVATTK
jgi:hypothetical protein